MQSINRAHGREWCMSISLTQLSSATSVGIVRQELRDGDATRHLAWPNPDYPASVGYRIGPARNVMLLLQGLGRQRSAWSGVRKVAITASPMVVTTAPPW